jgi:hypothetical protein
MLSVGPKRLQSASVITDAFGGCQTVGARDAGEMSPPETREPSSGETRER